MGLPARNLYNIAFHIHKHYEPARVVAVYALVQKVGCLRPPRRDSFGGDFFAAAECGIYLQRCFEDNEALLARDDAWTLLRPVIALGAEMCNDESASRTGNGAHLHAWRHRHMATRALIYFDDAFNQTASSEAIVREGLDRLPPSQHRHELRYRLTRHLVRHEKNYDEAVRHVELMIAGHDCIETIDEGVWFMQEMAKRLRRRDLWEKSVELGRASLAANRDTAFAHDLHYLQQFIDRPMPQYLDQTGGTPSRD